MPNTSDRQRREYLGDGIYVYFTGYSYEISVNDHRNPFVVSFEDSELDAFIRFRERMKTLHDPQLGLHE